MNKLMLDLYQDPFPPEEATIMLKERVHPHEIVVREVQRDSRPQFSTFLLNASVSRVNRRMLIRMVRFCRSMRLVEISDGSGSPAITERCAPTNVRRAIPPASHWLGFVKFNHLAVINICAESPLRRFNVSREGIR
jgi:hypothetical protein